MVYTEVIRCPFYDFSLFPDKGLMVSGEGSNRCGLVTDAHAPCQMQVRNKTPHWRDCPLNNKEARKRVSELLKSITVFPAGQTEAIPLEDWYEGVTQRK